MSGYVETPGGDDVEELIAFLLPPLTDVIARINVDRFTTVEFIEVLQQDPAAQAAYDDAVRRWREDNPELAKLVIHGQVIPQVLRRSGLVEWDGYAYGEHDPYAVPAWWRKVTLD
jgi:hypothetical protein